jgi:hypothetical protein
MRRGGGKNSKAVAVGAVVTQVRLRALLCMRLYVRRSRLSAQGGSLDWTINRAKNCTHTALMLFFGREHIHQE